MGAPVLVCECGVRLRAPGASAGRVGRCPKCGATLTFQGPDTAQPRAKPRREALGGGYVLDPAASLPSQKGPGPLTEDVYPLRVALTVPKQRPPLSDGLIPPLARVETWWGPSALYPLRGADSLAMLGIMGTAFWVFTILVPEYCLTILGDSKKLDSLMMGYLVALISALPAAFLALPTIIYTLQYLGRVLVSGAMGENCPPRTPDRNFEGFLSGLSPWFLWLFNGLVVGLLPLALYWGALAQVGHWNPLATVVLLCLGWPYAQMALMVNFLHDNPAAGTPATVLGAIAKLGGSYLSICVVDAAALGTGVAVFIVALSLRQEHFWVYVLAALACWVVLLWIAIFAMRVLGTLYYRHREVLRWHRDRPRWGVHWGLWGA